MEKITLGQSEIVTSRIVFGAWAIGGWLWGGTDKKKSIEAIDAAFDLGISSFDTAPVYGFGLSEELLGEALKGKRHQCEIFSKFGLRWDLPSGYLHSNLADEHGNRTKIYRNGRKESIIYECEQSLKRLNTDYIDLLQIHWPDPETPIAESMEAISILKQAGKIRSGGVCNYNQLEMKEAVASGTIVSNQVPYSMVHRGIEEEVAPYAIEQGLGILAYSPLQRGLLTGKITEDYSFAPGDHRPNTMHFKVENIRAVNSFLSKIKPIADESGASLAQLVIQWTLKQKGISHVLVGARNKRQAMENAAANSIQLDTGQLAEIQQYLEKVQLQE